MDETTFDFDGLCEIPVTGCTTFGHKVIDPMVYEMENRSEEIVLCDHCYESRALDV